MTEKMNEALQQLLHASREQHPGNCHPVTCGASEKFPCLTFRALGRIAEIETSEVPRIVLSGDTGGGRRELVISVNGERVGRFDYEECGWTFRRHAKILKELGEALGVPVIDETI